MSKHLGMDIRVQMCIRDRSYEEEFCSIASFDEIKDQVIIVSGFSKAHAMTGWRLGCLLYTSRCV